MEYEILKLAIEKNIGIIIISRPKAMNALNTAFFAEMNSMLDELSENEDIRALIITGEGKAFVAGADIAEMSGMNSEQGTEFSKIGQNVFDKIEAMPFPTIAAINGFALGGGLELTLACDIRIANTKALMGQPEVNLGLIPGYAGTQRLARLVGMGDALYLLYTADMISAEEALRIKLVQKVTEPEELMETALKIASKISKKGKNAIKQVKKVTRNGLNMNFNDGQNLEAKIFGSLFETKETKEGMNAFLEKRKPNW